jgi:hypothetical protein
MDRESISFLLLQTVAHFTDVAPTQTSWLLKYLGDFAIYVFAEN